MSHEDSKTQAPLPQSPGGSADGLTPDRIRRIKRLSHRVRKALDEALEVAREMGIRRPAIYVEGEGPNFHVMDSDHPDDAPADGSCVGRAQAAIVFTLPDSMPPGSDVGAW